MSPKILLHWFGYRRRTYPSRETVRTLEPRMQRLVTPARIAAPAADNYVFRLKSFMPVERPVKIQMFDRRLIFRVSSDARMFLHCPAAIHANRVPRPN